MSVSFSVRGSNELRDYLDKGISDGIKQGIDEALNNLGNDIFHTTTAIVPVRTGYLLKSIDITPPENDAILAKAGADYASYVDDGTRFFAGRHYFKEPIAQLIGPFERKLIDSIAKHLIPPGAAGGG